MMAIMAKQLLLLFVLAIVLSPTTGYICRDDDNSPRDAFEDHGCSCGTDRVSNNYPHLFVTYYNAFEGCHEANNADVTIECAFRENDAHALELALNRTPLTEIPIVENGPQIYREVTCL